MENKNKIPTYVFALIAIVIVAVIYIFVVQIPFSKAQPGLEAEHQSAASQLKIYEDAFADIENLRKDVSDMKAKYEKDSASLFINASQSPKDIMKMLKESKTQPTTYKISEQKVDDKGRKSSGGDLLYSTDISITFDALDDAQIKSVLNYFESASNGAYYVDKIDIKAVERNSQDIAKESTDEESGKDESKAESSKSSGNNLSSLYFTGKYQVTITLKLYYFLPADQTPEAIKAEASAATQSADPTASAAPTSSTASGAESSAA